MSGLTCTCMGRCDGSAVSHIDDRGYVYCAPCGEVRKWSHRCRKLRPHELRRLERGEPLQRY